MSRYPDPLALQICSSYLAQAVVMYGWGFGKRCLCMYKTGWFDEARCRDMASAGRDGVAATLLLCGREKVVDVSASKNPHL